MLIEKSEIIENIQIAEGIWRMVFTSSEIANEYVGAGQFVSILIDDNWVHLIRRPMSIAEVSDNKISIIYKVFGKVTQVLTKLRSNDYIDVLGPLGNVFSVDISKYDPILIGGGIGISPIINLSKYLTQKKIAFTSIFGAKTAREHFLQHNHNNVLLSTDDGTIGIKGTIIDALNTVLTEIDNPKIFACGPEQMLSYLQFMLKEKGIPAQFSVESYMACGVGFCQGCAIHNKQNNGYHLVCKDGPVFEMDEVNFD